MSNTKTKSAFDIRKKLFAAVAMLLVATIMMVSATYAWFTLSTAPEVKGITTTVGANGNLEIALMNAASFDSNGSSITSGIGDSMDAAGQEVVDANITWGNLVDLANEAYGLGQIALLPSQLNLNGANNVNVDSMLMIPTYGSDGRVKVLEGGKITSGIFDGTAFPSDTAAYGVRALGTASELTDRQLAFLNTKSAMRTAASDAVRTIKNSLSQDGGALATIMVKHATAESGGSESYDSNDVQGLKNIVAGLKTAAAKIDAALLAAINGYAASGAEGANLTDEQYAAYVEATKNITTVSALATAAASVSGFEMPTALSEAIGKYTAMTAKIADAETAVNGLGDAPTWTQISTAMNGSGLVAIDALTVNGMTADEIGEDQGAFISAVLAAGGVTVSMPAGSGVYADFAEFCGDYNAEVRVEHITYGNMLNDASLNATMEAKQPAGTPVLTALSNTITGLAAPASASGSTSAKINEFYGYVLDFYLRTNAADSNLLLQTEGAQRVYDGSENAATQGGGSYMEFTVDTDLLPLDNQLDLMRAIRVVFMDTRTGAIYATAALDVANLEQTVEDEIVKSVKAELMVTKTTVTTSYTVNEDFGEYTEGRALTATEYSKVSDEDKGKVTVETTSTSELVTGSDAVLAPMVRNQPLPLSAVVYLDGNLVDNSMVANAASSMTGKLNLQFSSSADLQPMQNNELFNGQQGTETTTTEPETEPSTNP